MCYNQKPCKGTVGSCHARRNRSADFSLFYFKNQVLACQYGGLVDSSAGGSGIKSPTQPTGRNLRGQTPPAVGDEVIHSRFSDYH